MLNWEREGGGDLVNAFDNHGWAAYLAIFFSSELLSAPTTLSTSLPFLTKKKVGTLLIFHRAAASLASSMSTFKNTTFGYFSAKLVKRGEIKRHGPHHVAVKYRIDRRDVAEAALNILSNSLEE